MSNNNKGWTGKGHIFGMVTVPTAKLKVYLKMHLKNLTANSYFLKNLFFMIQLY